MKFLMGYMADKGSCVINGVCFSNGVGDGVFDVYFDNQKSKEPYKEIWFDLRDENLSIRANDCDSDSAITFTKEDLDCNAVYFRFDNGNLIIGKYF